MGPSAGNDRIEELSPRLLQYCRPPLAVIGKPVVAHFRVNLGPAVHFEASLERDLSGNTRIELRDPASQAPHFGLLWSLKDKVDKLLFYHERFVAVCQWPTLRNGNAWSFGTFEAEWTDQHEKLVGRDARRVILRKHSKGAAVTRYVGECWISESLLIVMRERILGRKGNIQEWEVTRIDEQPPAGDVLVTPPGFHEIDRSRKR